LLSTPRITLPQHNTALHHDHRREELVEQVQFFPSHTHVTNPHFSNKLQESAGSTFIKSCVLLPKGLGINNFSEN
jgi:hypothetical protein